MADILAHNRYPPTARNLVSRPLAGKDLRGRSSAG
jgi:hypothetical protein